jgi:hypothetical protein
LPQPGAFRLLHHIITDRCQSSPRQPPVVAPTRAAHGARRAFPANPPFTAFCSSLLHATDLRQQQHYCTCVVIPGQRCRQTILWQILPSFLSCLAFLLPCYPSQAVQCGACQPPSIKPPQFCGRRCKRDHRAIRRQGGPTAVLSAAAKATSGCRQSLRVLQSSWPPAGSRRPAAQHDGRS